MSTQRHPRRSAGDAPLSIEIHGAVTPKKFDVLSGLAYVHAYLELLSGVAQSKNESVHFTGLRLRKGSVAFDISVDEPVIARRVAKESNEMLAGRRLAPRGLRTRVHDVRKALSRMPAGNSAHVSVDNYSATIVLPDEDLGHLYESLQLRVSVYRVGGTPPRISVVSEIDGGFTLSIDRDLAASVARHLYQEVDLVARVGRDADGRIVQGKALGFFPLDNASSENETKIWRAWFAEAGSDWDEVEDIEVELDRYRADTLRG